MHVRQVLPLISRHAMTRSHFFPVMPDQEPSAAVGQAEDRPLKGGQARRGHHARGGARHQGCGRFRLELDQGHHSERHDRMRVDLKMEGRFQ